MIQERNTNAMFKPGDKVIILGTNSVDGVVCYGGRIGGHVGKTYTLRHHEPHGGEQVHERWKPPVEGADGYWYMEEIPFVWHCSQFKLAEERKEEVKPKEINYNLLLVKDLRKICKEKGIVYNNLRKAGIIAALKALEVEQPKPALPDYVALGKDLAQEASGHACCNYSVIKADGKAFEAEYRTGKKSSDAQAPCHASLQRRNGPWKYLILDVQSHRKIMPPKMQEQYDKWVEYWIKHSPLAHLVINPTLEQVMDHGVVLDATKGTLSQFTVFAIGLREGSEFAPRRLPLFGKLLDRGISPRIAWAISCNYVEENGFLKENFWTGGHQVHTSGGSMKDFCAFLFKGTMFNIEREIILANRPARHRENYLVSRALTKEGGGYMADAKNSIRDVFRTLTHGLANDRWIDALARGLSLCEKLQ